VATLSSANAVDIEFYNSNETFARKIGSFYEEAPAALKAKMLGAKIIAVGNTDTFYKVQLAHGAPRQSAAKFSDGNYIAVARQGTSNTARALTFVQSKFEKSFAEYQRCSVFHEMAHLRDFGPKGTRANLSDASGYRRAFAQDRNGYVAYVRANPKDKTFLDAEIGYYFSQPQEAFAESTARALCASTFKPQQEYVQKVFELFLPNAYAYVKALMHSSAMMNERTAGSGGGVSKVGAFSISFMGINLSFGVRRYYAPRRHYASSPRRQHTRSTSRQETRSVERVVPSPSAVDNVLRPSRVTVPAS
jgi:hypothetical protein